MTDIFRFTRFDKLIFVLVGLLLLLNTLFASWYVLHGDIYFSADVARDMWIFKEVDQKKFILIGPRSSVGGLYHGPLWIYLTYPGYLMGHGNPVFLGWFWVILYITFLTVFYFLAKKLFDRSSAMVFVMMVSAYLIFRTREFVNPHGAFFLVPLFFFTYIRYVQTFRLRHLVLHILFAGGMIQMQMAVGIPLSILSSLAITYVAWRNNRFWHIIILILYLIPFSTYIWFDFRHSHILVRNIFRHLGTMDPKSTFLELVFNRIVNIFSSTEFLHFNLPNINMIPSTIFFVLLFFLRKGYKYSEIYLWFCYFYFGFFLFSLLNRYDLLYNYTFPMFSLVFLVFSSLVTSKFRKLFLGVFIFVYLLDMFSVFTFIGDSKNIIGKSQFSWRALLRTSSIVYSGPEREFGYFIYSPDIFGYGPRYAMDYARGVFNKNGYAFEKKPVTYIINEPPSNNPTTTAVKFKYGAVRIENRPIATWYLDNNFVIDKYLLTENQQKITFDFGINPGLFYR